jgi:glucose-6-phosphate 1-dehydrogenase
MGHKKMEKPESCTMVVFGASGDLTKRKLVPALFNLQQEGLLPDQFNVIGFGRREMSSDEFRQKAKVEYREFLTEKVIDPEKWEQFIAKWQYVSGNFDDPEAYKKIQAKLEGKSGSPDGVQSAATNCIFYLATPPKFFSIVVQNLAALKLTEERDGQWKRVIVEKPFGRDLESALTLNKELKELVAEHQIYRIDHYLGKETVQNIMVLRFANGIFEPIWNRRYIDHVQITVSETLGIESRASYYETSGALRDMVPNHMFQLLSLIGMEPPSSFDAEAVRNEKSKVLKAIRPMSDADILTHAVRGQYGRGTVDGKNAVGYRQEPDVNPQSRTETFAAMKLFIDNWRWAEVPFYLRTGKRMASRTSEISIRFKCAPFQIFRDTSAENLCSNELFLQIQPQEKITLSFEAKIPGPEVEVRPVAMNFNYADTFREMPTTGYETLIYDCMMGDATLFQRSDQIESAWSIVSPILQVWGALPPHHFPNYAAGTWGPEEANQLIAADGRHWREIDDYARRKAAEAA